MACLRRKDSLRQEIIMEVLSPDLDSGCRAAQSDIKKAVIWYHAKTLAEPQELCKFVRHELPMK